MKKIVVALLGGVLLAGCSALPEPAPSDSVTASSSSPSEAVPSSTVSPVRPPDASPTPSVSPAPAPVELPEGYQWAVSPVAGAQFAVPQDWTVIDLAVARKDPDKAPQRIQDEAAKMGLTPEEMVQTFDPGMSVAAFAPGDGLEGVDNVVLLVQPGTLPSKDEMLGMLGDPTIGLDVSDVSYSEALSPWGLGRAVRYMISDGSRELHAGMLAYQGDPNLMTFMVANDDASSRDAQVQVIIDTLSRK